MRANAKRIGLADLSFADLDELFGHDVPPELWQAAGAHAQDQSSTPFGQPWPMSAWPDVPTRVLASREDRLFPLEFQRSVARDRLGVEPDVMEGGHLVALSRPDELADRLSAYASGTG